MNKRILKPLTAVTICLTTSSVLAISPPAPPGCPLSTYHFESVEAVPIPSGPAVVTSQLNVSGLEGLLWDVDVQL
ncbi:MAG: hypothetical protein KDA33_02745, partial [Phycisphaerales bacterium]|nr:hypothetical protein [Phycisphaerales bacterium]